MTRRWRLFPKYALLIITLVGSMLIASGAIGIYFSWRENEAHLAALQVEKAQNAAYRIEQYIVDIEHELSWTALPTRSSRAASSTSSCSARRRRSPRSSGSIPRGASSCASRAWRWTRSAAAPT